jgi:hypothetical protein
MAFVGFFLLILVASAMVYTHKCNSLLREARTQQDSVNTMVLKHCIQAR